ARADGRKLTADPLRDLLCHLVRGAVERGTDARAGPVRRSVRRKTPRFDLSATRRLQRTIEHHDDLASLRVIAEAVEAAVKDEARIETRLVGIEHDTGGRTPYRLRNEVL